MASNEEWAEGFFKQACFDRFHGLSIRKSRHLKHGASLSLAQFQQAVEKAMKAAVLWETKKRLNREDMIKLEHQIWQRAISREPHLKPLRKMILGAIDPWTEKEIVALENFAPSGALNMPNTEYPWEQSAVEVPSEYFFEKKIVSQMESLAEAIVLKIAGCQRRFHTIFEFVKLLMDISQSPLPANKR